MDLRTNLSGVLTMRKAPPEIREALRAKRREFVWNGVTSTLAGLAIAVSGHFLFSEALVGTA